jgi:hypothetical protein
MSTPNRPIKPYGFYEFIRNVNAGDMKDRRHAGLKKPEKCKIAGMARPGYILQGDKEKPDDDELKNNLAYLYDNDYRTIISIEKRGADRIRRIWCRSKNCKWYGSFLWDWNAPSAAHLAQYVERVNKQLRHGNVVTHCIAGHGRTGSFLTAYFLSQDQNTATADQALRKVRKKCEHAAELAIQYNAVARFGDMIGKRHSPPFDYEKIIPPLFDNKRPFTNRFRNCFAGLDTDPGHDGDLYQRNEHGKYKYERKKNRADKKVKIADRNAWRYRAVAGEANVIVPPPLFLPPEFTNDDPKNEPEGKKV